MKFVPQSLTDELQEHYIQVVKTYPDLLNHSTCSHLLRYWVGILGISVHCWNETSEHGVANRIICGGWETDHFWTIFMSNIWSTNNFCLKEKHQILLQVLESLLKHVLRGGPQFRGCGRALEIPAVWQYTCSFCHGNEVHAGKLWHVGGQPPTVFTFSCSIWLFCSWKWKPSLKEQDFRTSRTSVM